MIYRLIICYYFCNKQLDFSVLYHVKIKLFVGKIQNNF